MAEILPWGATPLVSSSCKAVSGCLKEEFALLEHAKPIVIADDDFVPGTSERFVFPGSRRRSTGLGKGNRTAWGGRADRPFFGRCSQSALIVAALENGSVEILDIRRGERAAEIKGLEEPQGVYYDFKTGRLYVATGGDGKLRIYDGKSLTVQETLGFGGDADNVRYDEQTGNIWVGYGNGAIAIANAAGQNVGSVVLDTHPESFQFEPNGDRVYVNVPKQISIAVVAPVARPFQGWRAKDPRAHPSVPSDTRPLNKKTVCFPQGEPACG